MSHSTRESAGTHGVGWRLDVVRWAYLSPAERRGIAAIAERSRAEWLGPGQLGTADRAAARRCHEELTSQGHACELTLLIRGLGELHQLPVSLETSA
jgi:hypothetical protein